jgi:ABC-type amino acid transport substrate-binding protein
LTNWQNICREDFNMTNRRTSRARAFCDCGRFIVCRCVWGSAAWAAGSCELTAKKGTVPLPPANPGVLTVETSLPSPGWWNGDTPDTIKDGYEYCLAENIAYRAGLDSVKVLNVAFDALVAGRTKDYDIALSSVSISEPRKKVVDFSVPYFNSDIGWGGRQERDEIHR